MTNTYILTLSCPDQRGIVHAVTGFLLSKNANIGEAAQYNDAVTGLFFMRVCFVGEEITHTDFEQLATQYAMKWQIRPSGDKMPTLIMVSKLGHCLHDLLLRYRSGLLPIDIRAIVSNHRDFYQLAATYNIPFYHIPVTPETKIAAEAELLGLIRKEGAELVVLARYMQVLSDAACKELDGKAINIHHSFLPSFKGARPYFQAYDRGVKLIGATAHYVTGDLDEGPIIEQDIARVDHAMDAQALTNIGRDVESGVLARAVAWHAQHRILRNGHKTVVFK